MHKRKHFKLHCNNECCNAMIVPMFVIGKHIVKNYSCLRQNHGSDPYRLLIEKIINLIVSKGRSTRENPLQIIQEATKIMPVVLSHNAFCRSYAKNYSTV